jgi:DNA-binding GntR family transcriptional regulator
VEAYRQLDPEAVLPAGAPAPGEEAVPPRPPELLRSRAYDLLVLDIVLGDHPADGRLEEQVLVAKHGVGLAGVRDALNRLALEGMVTRRPRFGTQVSPIDLQEVQQALEARLLIEPHLAAMAARHGSDALAAELRGALAEAEPMLRAQDYRALIQIGQRFYRALARAAGNIHLHRTAASLNHSAARLWIFALPQRSLDDQLHDIALHAELAEAVAARNPDRARAAMERVIAGFSDSVHRGVAACSPPGSGG